MNNYQLVKNTEWKEVEINGEDKEIPMDWEVKKFEDFSSICRGGSPRPIQNFLTEKKDGTPWIKISDATKVTKYIDSTEQYIKKEGESRSRIVYPGDLIVSNSATPGIPRFLNITACIHDGWLLLRDFNGVDKEFLFQLVGLVREKLKSQGSGSIFTNLSIDILSNFECLIPPIKTQSSIASILSAQESIISDIESLISKYESRFQYLSEELLSGKLRVKEVDGKTVLYKNPEDNWKDVEINGEMKEIPKDWEVEKISNVTECWDNKRKPLNQTERSNKKGSIPYWGANNIVDYINDYLIDEEVVLLGEDAAPFYDKSKKVAFISNEKIWPNNHIHVLKPLINSYFLMTILNSVQYEKIIGTESRPKLTQGMMNAIEFSSPLEKEMSNISSILLAQDFLIKKQKDFLIKEKQKFDWLLDNLLSGKYLIKE